MLGFVVSVSRMSKYIGTNLQGILVKGRQTWILCKVPNTPRLKVLKNQEFIGTRAHIFLVARTQIPRIPFSLQSSQCPVHPAQINKIPKHVPSPHGRKISVQFREADNPKIWIRRRPLFQDSQGSPQQTVKVRNVNSSFVFYLSCNIALQHLTAYPDVWVS